MNVTIEGSTTPCVELRRGERRTVQYSDYVQRLVNNGYVTILEWHDDDEASLTAGESGERATGAGEPPLVSLTDTEIEAGEQAAASRLALGDEKLTRRRARSR